MRTYLTNLFMISLAVAFLVNFILLVLYGKFYFQEPNLLILWAEIALMVGIIIFGIYNIVRGK